ncbi:hypothetical protein MCJ35_24130 [Enterocloster sp. OA13]|uniref:hypothetical protein n=1 Tax=Enterocloster sp. OA13 TaxID=2914161 RepID=UPI0006879D91|nr:hypothetical protein [Enterocloster sp. OA13]
MRYCEIVGRKCYDHLGGKLGNTLLEFLVQQQWIELKSGTSTTYALTQKGYENFLKLGLDLPQRITPKGDM